MPPLVIAHRGDSDARPENTLVSFASALEIGAELVELDVQLTKDGHVVVIHDPTVDRTTDGSGDVRAMTLSQLRTLSAGYPGRFGDAYRGERVPTLAEALGLFKGRARVMIEIKSDSMSADADGGIEALTIAEVRRAHMAREVVLLCFEPEVLRRCRRLGPEVVRGHLFYRATVDDVVRGAQDVASPIVMPEKGMLSDELCERCRRGGIKVATWVVDDPRELTALARFDLYGIGSNRPAALMEALLESSAPDGSR
jgi:glycerophosphoryl diester phosphodiesterase